MNRTAILLILAILTLVSGFSFTIGQSITSTSDVRIVAQKLSDGRIEFGLQQDGERILPSSRFFPVNAEANRWLRSSPISVSVPAPTESAEATTPANEDVGIASGVGPDVAFVYLPEALYRCAFEVRNNTGSYGSGTNVVVEMGGYNGFWVNEIEASGRWVQLYTAVDGTGSYHALEVDVAQGARWTMTCTLIE